MITTAIILAGGLGTRLREALPLLPKSMAPVADRPILSHIIDALRMQGVQKFIFSLGYKSNVIEEYLQSDYPTLEYTTVIETEPLGTGGGIALAIRQTNEENILVVNGDTLFKIELSDLYNFHLHNNAACTLALKPMQCFDRYGVVDIDDDGKIISFQEKKYYDNGFINGGVYILNKIKFQEKSLPQKFSFEKDYLEKYYLEGNFFGHVQSGYFIDIGIPEDYSQAQVDLKFSLDLENIDKSWTLFLDRDGVINEERVGEYILHWDQFIFSKGVLEVFKKLSDHFGRIIIVSNQRGVERGFMTEASLQTIHLEMEREVQILGGKIDHIYYCTAADDKDFYRKPNPGMAFRAKQDFKDIEFTKSIMVGNKPSDMKFGRAAGMFTVFVTTTNPNQQYPHKDIDLLFPTLAEFANVL